jgi:hypothetical protein
MTNNNSTLNYTLIINSDKKKISNEEESALLKYNLKIVLAVPTFDSLSWR